MAFKGGLSFNLNDVIIPPEKEQLVDKATSHVAEVMENYNMGLITNNERYNQIIDIWTHTNSRLTNILMDRLETDKQGFNSIYMMMHSGARGSKEQIRQLSGMRGLMAKPQKSSATGGKTSLRTPSCQTSRKACPSGVLHLNARCAKGSCRYCLEDGRRRLLDASFGRRGSGCDHHRRRLPHVAQTHHHAPSPERRNRGGHR